MGIAKEIIKTFLRLTDTPSSFSGQESKVLAVNSAENAVEFISGIINFDGGNASSNFISSSGIDGGDAEGVGESTFLQLTD